MLPFIVMQSTIAIIRKRTGMDYASAAVYAWVIILAVGWGLVGLATLVGF